MVVISCGSCPQSVIRNLFSCSNNASAVPQPPAPTMPRCVKIMCKIQHPTSNIQHPIVPVGSVARLGVGCWALDFGCSFCSSLLLTKAILRARDKPLDVLAV